MKNIKNENSELIVKKHQKCEKPKVSVIVPVFKVERYLAQCLNSIINQTLEEIEIIIVDEGLQDRCREIIDFYESIDPRIIAPHENNGGYGASCNLGIKMAKGEYIAIVESDDFIEPEMYEEMYDYAKALDADIVKTPYIEYYSNGPRRNCTYRNYMREVTPSKACFSMKQFGNMLEIHASLWAAIYRTSYLRNNNIEFIKAKGGAYVDVGFRIDTLIHSNKIAWLDKPYYNYRVDSEGSTTNNFNLLKMIERWKEAHEKFIPIQDDYDKYYGKFLIRDEFLTTVNWLKLNKFTDEQFENIYKNLSYIKDETILDSTVLTKKQKKILLMYKNEKNKCKFILKSFRIYINIKNKIINLIFRTIKTRNILVLTMLFLVSTSLRYLYPSLNIFNTFVIIFTALICIYALSVAFYILLHCLFCIKRYLQKK